MIFQDLGSVQGRYNVLYVDPPWQYEDLHVGRHGAVDEYELMDIDSIKSFPIQNITEDNAVLFMWATVPLLDQAFEVISAWGFKYKTSLFWEKTGLLGLGRWFRGQVEILTVSIRGDVKPFGLQRKNIVTCIATGHSKKPDIFRDIIEDATVNIPDRRMIELFARRAVAGWDSMGNELPKRILSDVYPRL